MRKIHLILFLLGLCGCISPKCRDGKRFCDSPSERTRNWGLSYQVSEYMDRTIHLTDGTVISGKILSEKDGTLEVETKGKKIQVEKTDIETVE